MAGMLRKYVEDNGTDSLVPSRKNPLTNEMINAMLEASLEGASCEGWTFTVRWGEHFWKAVRAAVSALRYPVRQVPQMGRRQR